MIGMLEGCGGGVSIVSVIVDPFGATFIYKSFSSGQFISLPGITNRRPGRGVSMFVVLGGCGRHTDGVLLSYVFF